MVAIANRFVRVIRDQAAVAVRRSPLRRRDVLVEAEEVVRVVAALQLAEAGPGGAGIGRADRRLVLVAEEADVAACAVLAEGVGEAGDPGVVGGSLSP
jgi:hypothetical protein